MATTIVTKSGSGAPTASDLVAGELAVDLTNKRLYTEDSGGTVIEVGSNPYNFTANHDGSAKIATTATGIDVTGTVTADGLTVSNASGGNVAAFTNTSSADLSINLTSGVSLITPSTGILAFGTSSTERLRIDASGNVGIGVVPSAWGSSTPAFQILNGSIYGYGTYESGYSTNLYYDGGWKHISTQVASQYRQTESGHQWFNAASASAGATATMVQAMTLDASGNLLVGTTTSGATKLKVVGEASEYAGYFEYQSSGYGLGISNVGGSGSTTAIFFFNTNGAVGSIATSGSATTYNTSSDERLKENIADADDAGSKIDAIQVRKFDWKADGSHQDYGMVAQELLEVAPEAVSQGETEEEMMGVDYSKLVPMMLKEIQSLRQRIAALES
jgi:hypothetical protein